MVTRVVPLQPDPTQSERPPEEFQVCDTKPPKLLGGAAYRLPVNQPMSAASSVAIIPGLHEIAHDLVLLGTCPLR